MTKIKYKLRCIRMGCQNTPNAVQIAIAAYQEKKRRIFPTGIFIRREQWNPEFCQICCHPNGDGLNMMLQEKVIEVERKEIELWRKHGNVTLQMLYDGIISKKRDGVNEQNDEIADCNDIDLSHYMRNVISEADISDSTRKNRLVTTRLIDEFKPGLKLSTFDVGVIAEFDRWLSMRGCCRNTIAKHLTIINTCIKFGIKNGTVGIERNPFYGFTIKREPVRKVTLTFEELDKLEAYSKSGTMPDVMRHCLDAFLFCCYTGLRYSDFTNLRRCCIDTESDEVWITFKSIKTGTLTRIPSRFLFGGKGVSILRRYWGDVDSFFELPSNPYVDKLLKDISKNAGLHKHISFHTARHTNATLLLCMGVRVTTIQRLLGHRNLKTTMKYCNVMEETIVNELKMACGEKFNTTGESLYTTFINGNMDKRI